RGVKAMGVRVLRTPVRAPKANAVCERLGGSLRRECLDFLIPLTERHLKMTVEEWRVHYNRGRPHSSLGPGVPESNRDRIPASGHRHKLPAATVSRRPPCSPGSTMHMLRARPPSSLGPGVPESNRDRIPASGHRHKLPAATVSRRRPCSAGYTMNIA